MNIQDILQLRFFHHPHRHENISWEKVAQKLAENPSKLEILEKMEATGGEVDVLFYDEKMNEVWFADFSKESPSGRRSCCYDEFARLGRKKFPPEYSAEKYASEIGADLITESEYLLLQSKELVDTKTSSWLQTPKTIRELGGAIFGDCRFGRTFVYHNGAESYYAARGVRLIVKF